VGLAVKHRQLARQVRVFIEHPLENSMASFDFTSTVLDEGTTFIFGSWVYITNSLGGYNSHLADTKELEVLLHHHIVTPTTLPAVSAEFNFLI
jgi:hypothetical protein